MILKTAKKKIQIGNNTPVIDITKSKKIEIYPQKFRKQYAIKIDKKQYEFDFDFKKYYELFDFLKKTKKDFTIAIDATHIPSWFFSVSKEELPFIWDKWLKEKEKRKNTLQKQIKKRKRKIEKVKVEKEILINLRKQHKLTIDEFAKKVGVKPKKVTKVEMGYDCYTKKQIEKIEKVFLTKILT